MNATVNVVLFKSKTLSNGEHPLMLRVCKDNKKKYKSLGISIHPQYWDFDKNSPRKNCPNKQHIQKIIADKIAEYSEQILELKVISKDYTASTLVQNTEKTIKIRTVGEFYNELISAYKVQNNIGNARIYNDSYRSLKSFTNDFRLDFLFADITIEWLIRYEKWLLNRNCAPTTISLLFRTLRSAFNKAIEQNIVRKENYPFDTFKISKFNTKTTKRAITKDEIKMIINLNLSDEPKMMQFSRDIFVFSYLQGGINFTDIANLKYENIADSRLQYTRQKTRKKFNLQIQEESQRILDEYTSSDTSKDDYIFPILNKKLHKTAMQRFNRIHKIIGYINPNLKLIAEKAGIDANLTTYMRRHTNSHFRLITNSLQGYFSQQVTV